MFGRFNSVYSDSSGRNFRSYFYTNLVFCFIVLVSASCFAAGRGIVIVPDPQGNYHYVDQFPAWRLFNAKFLTDPFLTDVTVKSWGRQGRIVNAGPDRNRMMTYRFYSEQVIAELDVRIEQGANAQTLGGQNLLYLSSNGIDWTLIATSEKQNADANGWQIEPLTISSEQAKNFVGQGEVWIRVVLDNTIGVKTITSSYIDSIDVKLKVSNEVTSQHTSSLAWVKLLQEPGVSRVTLDWSDPIGSRPPHYYEDSDGWLQPPGGNPLLGPDETSGFPVRRTYNLEHRYPTSLVTFIKTDAGVSPMMAKMLLGTSADSSRKMQVLWDGKLLGTIDARSFFDEEVFFVEIPGPQNAGVHKLRITGGDNKPILLKQITVVGSNQLHWVKKPALLKGGRLEVLSAYYLPDPKPPADSQTVEGRHKKEERNLGMIFRPLQRMYAEHADFGAARVVVQNTGTSPVRIARLLFNGKPIEESYIDFLSDEWDARGVVWYRVRPKYIEPGQCAQVYIRFRRRLEGDRANVTINSENAPPVTASVSYKQAPPFTVDYVTTGKSQDILYVYARRSPDAQPDNVTGLRLDGRTVENIQIYGADFPGNVALIVAKLAEPLKLHQYHIAGVMTDSGKVVDAQFRVMPFFFMRTSYYVPAEFCAEYHMNLGGGDPAKLEKYGLRTNKGSGEIFEGHENTVFIFGPDEPDAHDWKGAPGFKSDIEGLQHAKGLGWHARMLANTGWQELIERHSPHAASLLMLNGTTRPLNWMIYGQFSDVVANDPYPNYGYHADRTVVRETLDMVRLCGRPNRLIACLETFNWGPFASAGTVGRYPLPAEYRVDVVQAIGSGMKGLTSWVTRSRKSGWYENEVMAKAVKNLNMLIEQVEDKLLIGTPIDLATSDAGTVITGNAAIKKWHKDRVWVSSLLCGPDTIVLAVVNHIPASNPDPPTVVPTKDVTITVQLPKFLQDVTALEVTENGTSPIACRVAEGKALIKLDSIESGRVFVLQRK